MTKVLLALLLALPFAASAQVDASIIPADAPDWYSMEDAITLAQAEDRILFVYGYASWCGFCARFDAEVLTDDDVQAYLNANYAPVRLDIEGRDSLQFFDARVTGRDLGGAMGISGTPTHVFVDTDGSLITKMPGYVDPETFLFALEYIHEEAYTTTPFDQFVVARRTGLSLQQSMGDLVAPPRTAPTEAQ
jgi:thioredoxin-related protein